MNAGFMHLIPDKESLKLDVIDTDFQIGLIEGILLISI